ncbi:MAG TPA: thiolase domain-containing protein, partial [Candidatus Bathyarchaeia archaeon]
YAQYQRKITIDQVLSARKTAHKPLGLYDFAPISDGASALILTSNLAAKKMTKHPITVLGCGSATDYLNYPKREDLSHFVAAELAMKSAAQKSKVKTSDLQVIEVYDQSTVMEMVSLEDLGFCKPGTAWKSIHGCENCYNIDGKPLYVNTNGGLKADGNPLGATGGAQIFEIYRQLRGEADERQVTVNDGSPKKGAVLEFEGFGTKAYVTILGESKDE